ncbi:MAG TPA: SCO family protein [Terriglobales bacterium]
MRTQFSSPRLFGLVLWVATVSGISAQAPSNVPAPARAAPGKANYHGGLVSPPLPKPEFTLTDTSGTAFDFHAKTQGYVTLLFFGYTHCPDMCPMQMDMIADALRKLPPVMAGQFKVVFVTTDPARDTGQVLRTYLDHFNKSFIGVTGSREAVEAAQAAANLPPATKGSVRPNGNYEVGHSAFVLAYTKDNLAHVIYPVGLKAEDWVHDLPFLISETWTTP